MTWTIALGLARRIGPWVALVMLVGVFVLTCRDRDRLRGLHAADGACLASVAGAKGAKPAGATCAPAVADAVARELSAADCEAGLGAPDALPRATCRPGVLRLAAERDARAAEVRNRDEELAEARTSQAAAVSRAEARARTTATRTVHARDVLQAAPHDAGGDLVLDAGRLRDLAGPDPAAGSGGARDQD